MRERGEKGRKGGREAGRQGREGGRQGGREAGREGGREGGDMTENRKGKRKIPAVALFPQKTHGIATLILIINGQPSPITLLTGINHIIATL